MRKPLLFGLTAIVATLLLSCSEKQPEGTCRIHGIVPAQYNDKRIFLVPLTGPATKETVDSVEIKDGRFEFETDTVMMAKILMDYHYRMGLQPLLVVTEPGQVHVVIDSISHATGTPQNDSLETWKIATEDYQRKALPLRMSGQTARADSLYLAYKQYTRRMAGNMKRGLLHDFLMERFPLTYKKQLPDGRVVTMDADKNVEIPD